MSVKKEKTIEEILGVQPIFFKPNTEFVKWIIDYAKGRMIIDAGCGEKFVLCQQLLANGAKAIVGIDLDLDMNEVMKVRMMKQDEISKISFHIIPGDITTKFTDFYTTDTREILLIFARPCHSNWVEEVISKKGKKVEVLYITIPENITKYNDLGRFKSKAKLLKHKGSSADKEVVYSIK